MSNLISNRWAASRGSETPCQGGNVVGTSTLDLDMTSVPPVAPLGPTVSMVVALLTSSVTHHVLSARRTHRRPWTSEEAQPSGDASSIYGKASQIGKKNKLGALADYKRLLRPLAPRPRRTPLRGILDIVRLQQRSSTVHWPQTLAVLLGAIAPSGGSHGELCHKKPRTPCFMNYRFAESL